MNRSTRTPSPLLMGMLVFISFSQATAQSAIPKDGTECSPELIQTRMSLILLGIGGSNVDYSIGGKNVDDFPHLKDLIYPLHDKESSQLIRDAEDADFAGSMFLYGGTAAGLYFALANKPIGFVGVDFIDRIYTGIFAAQFFWAPGLVFRTISAAKKFNAVEKYNDLVKDRNKAGMELRPCVFASKGATGLGLECDY